MSGKLDVHLDKFDPLKQLGEEILGAFKIIADGARIRLGQTPRGPRLDAFASINQATAEKLVKALGEIQQGRELDCRKLIQQPAIARLVIADEDDSKEVLYISTGGTVDPIPVRLCSYMSAKGRLASLSVGDTREVALPSGSKEYEVLEKVTFSPTELSIGWDAKPAIVHAAKGAPTTILSLRDLLAQAGVSEDDLDALDRMLAEADAENNVVSGLQRSILTAMQLRVQPILDRFQDDIFRLPLDSRLFILGPPGTGKTTTLIKRLRQKLDFAFLTEDERDLIQNRRCNDIEHPNSWLMFTPTELLKQFVKEAFNREDVPAPEQRIRTWDDFRHVTARRDLPILRSGTSSGLVMRDELNLLKPATIANQIGWFEAFDGFQRDLFISSIATEAERLEGAGDRRLAANGKRITTAITSLPGQPISFLTELASLLNELRQHSVGLREETRSALRRPLAQYVRTDPTILDALARHLATLVPDADEDLDEADGDDDDEEAVPQHGRRAAETAFIRALRARAIADASRRPPARASRAAHILSWIEGRGLKLPPLGEAGEKLLLQRAIVRILKAHADFVLKVPARYRQFRRAKATDGEWYNRITAAAIDVDPLEVDVILLAMMRASRQISGNPVMIRRLGDRVPTILSDITELQRNQILVDEATDFSPIQLAIMATLSNPNINSFFACGDFNQRMTRWGSRTLEELKWFFADVRVEKVNVAYRQSRRLTEFALLLGSERESIPDPALPEHVENEGMAPAIGMNLADISSLSKWLSKRIQEIEILTQQLPSIAVLVNHADILNPLADSLNIELSEMNVRAVACPKGQAIGPENDVRIFEIEYIKGLEFEAVFFVNIDLLAHNEPDLFDKYIYVGATRAATFLGLTCSSDSLPPAFQIASNFTCEDWKSSV